MEACLPRTSPPPRKIWKDKGHFQEVFPQVPISPSQLSQNLLPEFASQIREDQAREVRDFSLSFSLEDSCQRVKPCRSQQCKRLRSRSRHLVASPTACWLHESV